MSLAKASEPRSAERAAGGERPGAFKLFGSRRFPVGALMLFGLALMLFMHPFVSTWGLVANAVCPGWVHTDMGGEEAPRSPAKGAETPTWLARFKGGPRGLFWRDKSVIDW